MPYNVLYGPASGSVFCNASHLTAPDLKHKVYDQYRDSVITYVHVPYTPVSNQGRNIPRLPSVT